ncbi:MAG: CoA transferase [Chloroflexi bacterium]|nr:CoA transferase [Chloroflexota bacterium]
MPGPMPLEGVRVFELGIAIAAPNACKYFANFGAEVLRIESLNNPDVARLFASSWARARPELGPVMLDTSPYVSEMGAGKLSVGLDLKHPGGLAAARRLLRDCDVLITNYSSPAVKTLGLDYESVAAIRPDIVYVALPGFGSNPATPYYEFLAWGPNQAPLVGLDSLTGYADQEPAGIAAIAPPDYCSSLHAVIAVLTALEQRDRTGDGAYIDISQFEATIALLSPYLLDNVLNGHVQPRTGNRTSGAAPEGVYPCRGDDRWLAISCTTDDEWAALGEVAGRPAWAVDARFADAAGRATNADELDGHIGAWTAQYGADELAAWLQAAGVPAHAASDNYGVLADPQVRDRGYFKVRPSARFGRDLFSGNPLHLSDTPGSPRRAGPQFGQDTRHILRSVCGYSDGEIDALVAGGAAFEPPLPAVTLTRPYDAMLPVLIPGLSGDGTANE